MTRKFDGDELIFATHNKGKLAEVREILKGFPFTLSSTADFDLPEPEETGTTFLQNATIKALEIARATGKPAIADDSGLCVHALGGDPGVYSADWAFTDDGGRDFDMAMDKVIAALGDAADRSAHFVSCLVLAWPDGHVESVEGYVHGTIVWPKRGAGGHGYDPIFMPEGFDKTFGELSAEVKNKISHRAQSFEMMIEKCLR